MRVESSGWWSRMSGLFGKQGGPRKNEREAKRALAQIEDTDPQMRRSAAWRLGKFGSGAHEEVEALTKLMSDHNEYVRRAATWALKSLESK